MCVVPENMSYKLLGPKTILQRKIQLYFTNVLYMSTDFVFYLKKTKVLI